MSERFQRMRVPALPTILFADASEDYRSMARDALLEGRSVTDMRTVPGGAELMRYLERVGSTAGAVTPAPLSSGGAGPSVATASGNVLPGIRQGVTDPLDKLLQRP